LGDVEANGERRDDPRETIPSPHLDIAPWGALPFRRNVEDGSDKKDVPLIGW